MSQASLDVGGSSWSGFVDVNASTDWFLVEDCDIGKLPLSFDIREGNQFQSKSVLKKFLHVIAVRGNYEFKVDRSNSDFYIVSCIVHGCSWMMRASRISSRDIWVVRKFCSQHTCPRDVVSNEHRQASSQFVAELLKADFSRGIYDKARPRDVVALMRGKHGVEISYHVARKARNFALSSIRGTAERSYSQIPALCVVLKEKNPGSFCTYELDSMGRFLYFFMCLGASIDGWRHCRPVMSVDGSFLKSEFGGMMLMAVALDGNNHIFPLAFAIVDSENEKSWEWFFMNLRQAIGDREGLVIVSDRNVSIPKALERIYPTAEHGICIQHLLRNMNGRFKGLKVDGLFYRCAKAYRVEDFEYFMRRMEAVRPQIRQYLYDAGYEKWARAFCRRRRYDVMTTNISESMNAMLLEAREYPVFSLVESYRSLLQRWFYERRTLAEKTRTLLTARADVRLRDAEAAARSMSVYPMDVNQYQVVEGESNNIVDLITRTCTCLVWQSDEFPCSHAVAAMWKRKLDPADFAAIYFKNIAFLETYNAVIYPLGDKSGWNVSEDVLSIDVSAPAYRRPAGRPKMHRIPSVGEERPRLRCSRCKSFGHNKRTCKNQVSSAMGESSSKKMNSCQ